ncbi:MAG: hypothetical protein JNL70_01725 [Saprospiraceae bacterium]|nr:hypothetical protein [Saprospiraceae bacterium]
MKKSFRFLSILGLFFTAICTSFGQDAKPAISFFDEPKGYKTLGLDVGLSYQSSDVKSSFGGWGVGLTLEKNLAHQKGGAIDLGARGRLLYANSLGFNTSASKGIASNPAVNGTYNTSSNYTTEGSYFANYRTDQFELGLEAVLTLNRLRERTGVYATLFGGFGLDFFSTKIDQLDASGNKYNYKSLQNPTIADVKGLLDGKFETKADGFKDSLHNNFMPNIGFELGYHFSPRFMVVLGHKMTFTKTDLFDGQRWADNTTLTAKSDYHHYTNLQFKWILGERKRQVLDGDPPKITFLRPMQNPFNTYDNIETVRAEVLGVTFQEDVTLTVNGLQANFKFKNNELTSDVLLKKGENEIIVKGENQHGSNFKKLIINVLDKQRLPDPPINNNPTNGNNGNNSNNNNNNNTVQQPRVRFMNPASYSETDQNRQAIRVQVENVSNYQDVTLTINGRSYTDFRFSYGELSYDAPLTEGQNSIVVSGHNAAGSASDAITVNYRRQTPTVNYPVVRITSTSNPSENSYGGCSTTIEARVENVAGQRDITLTVNGRSTTDFSYNFSSKILRGTISLATGSNQIAIRARNDAGESSDRADVTCTQRQRNPPSVRISQPTNGSATDQKTIDVRATVSNITSKNEVAVYLNGFQTSDFSYYSFDKSVVARVNLNEGENNIRIRANNNDGSNEDIIRVTYRPKIISSPPRVTIAQPVNGTATKAQAIDLQANTVGIKDRNQVEVSLNSKGIQTFNFDPSTGIVTTRLNLDAGSNTIRVAVRNESGNDAATTTVTYSRPAENTTPRPPRVFIAKPADGSRVTEPVVTLEAQAENVQAGQRQVKVILNGVEMDAAMNVMRQIRQRLTLVEGVNTITVRAKTQDGADEKMVRVTYSKTVITPPSKDGGVIPSRNNPTPMDSPKPTIQNFNVTQPVTDPFDPKPLVSVVTATITKVQKASILFKVNGEDVTNFDFDDLTGQFRYSFPIKSGQSYTFLIRAANLDGDAEKTETVKF